MLVVRVAGQLVQHLLDLGGAEAGQEVLDINIRGVQNVAPEGDCPGHVCRMGIFVSHRVSLMVTRNSVRRQE